MSRPKLRTRPAIAFWKPAMVRSSVVLPQPDEPRIATNSPGATERSTPSTTIVAP